MKKHILLFWLIGILGFSQENSLFDEANTLYNNGEYENAISIYQQIINDGLHSSALYFNMANCYYKLNKIAPSIYHYEKALKLSPEDQDILNNLSFAEQMTVDKFDVVPEMKMTKLFNKIAHSFHVDAWAVLCVLLMCMIVLCFISYYLMQNTKSKRTFFVLGLVLILVLISTFSLLNKKQELDHNRFAVIFSQEVSIKSEPNLKSDTAFILHEGTKAQILEVYKDTWSKIKLIDGKVGWVLNDAFKEL